MKIMTSQKNECVKLLFDGAYVPDFEKSEYAEEERYRTAYKIILSELERKTNIIARNNESCVWGWVGRIFMGFYDFHFGETSLFFDISEKEVVLIDYDKYMLYVEGETEEMDFFVENLDEADCVQCVCWVTSIEMKRIEKNITVG